MPKHADQPLTDPMVRGAKPKVARYALPDGAHPGLELRVAPGGAKSWAWRYWNAAGAQKRLTLGSYPAMALEGARKAARRAQVAATPDATLAEHCAVWAAATGVRLSTATMSRTLARLDQPQKKSR